MITLPERQLVVTLLSDAKLAGARQQTACAVLGLSVRTIQRWQAGGEVSPDQRLTRCVEPANKLSQVERRAILERANSAEFGHLPPSQIVPRLADRGEYLASESTFYRVLRANQQVRHRRGRPSFAKTPQTSRAVRH